MAGEDNPTLDRDALASPIPHPPPPSGVPARYEILRELGSGGMGIVYQARDKETSELVALKVLRPEIAADAIALERFKNELRLARKITHKNVCRIHEFHSATGGACISMEYVEGQSLRSLLSRVEGLSVHQGMKFLRQILSGMAEAHAQGVVHRDLKPENILVTPDGTAKVMDFGIAVTGEAGATVQGISGTPAYMSPEQAEGKAADARSDIYSLGLVMFELFTGHAAMAGETPLAVVHKQIHELPHSPRDYEPDLPERIDRAIQKCLEKDPKRRFQTVAELEAALEKNAPLPASEEQADPEPPEHLGRWAKFGDSVLAVLGVIALLYFGAMRDSVFPTAGLRLEVDSLSARRAAVETAKRLGMPFGEVARIESSLGLRGWLRNYGSFSRSDPSQPVSWRAEPLVFRIRVPFSDRVATVDRKGRVERLESWAPNALVSTPEENRRIAQQAVVTLCGPIPAGLRLVEGAGGEKRATYIAEWNRGLLPTMRASLVGDKPTEINCNVPAENNSAPWPFYMVRWLTGCWGAAIVVVAFLIGRCYRLAARWKRLGLALVLGAILAWMASSMIAAPGDWNLEDLVTKGRLPPPILLFLAGIGFSVVLWVGLVTAEYKLRRSAPQWIAGYLQFWRGRWTQPAVLLAVVRGGAIGTLLLAFETALAHLSMHGYRSFLVDHDALQQAIHSGWPAGFAVLAALFDGVVGGGILLALAYAASTSHLQSPQAWRRWLHRFIFVPFWWFISAQHLHLIEFAVGPRESFDVVGVFFLETVFLAWVLRHYDILTVMAAVFTFTLWIIDWPLLGVFETVGNGAYQAVLAGWFVLMLGAAAMAFRAHLSQSWRQVQERIG